jgi:hypothetical protein
LGGGIPLADRPGCHCWGRWNRRPAGALAGGKEHPILHPAARNCEQLRKDLGSDAHSRKHRFESPPCADKKIDLGIVASPAGHRIFIESVGIGLLASFMGEMRIRERKEKSRSRLSPEERLSEALKHLRLLAKTFPEAKCELLLDEQRVEGDILLFEVANMGLIGPNLDLVSSVNPADGRFEVVWTGADQRKQWRNYLKFLRSGVQSTPSGQY